MHLLYIRAQLLIKLSKQLHEKNILCQNLSLLTTNRGKIIECHVRLSETLYRNIYNAWHAPHDIGAKINYELFVNKVMSITDVGM